VFVSDSHKLVFVHIQKTGGITVDRLLRAQIPDLRAIAARHGFARQGMDKLDDWDEHFKFAFVRNPWDRLVSWYSMLQTMRRDANELRRYMHDNSSTFEEFIYNCTDEVEIKKGVHYSFAYNQLDYVTDEHGNLLVDFIGRLENFDEDLPKVFGRIGIELETIPRKNPSDHRHYSTFYTPDTEMIVRERFKRDIEYFGYEFERPQTSHDPEVREGVSADSSQRAQRRIDVDGEPKETGSGIRVSLMPQYKPPTKPRLLFVCGCDKSGTAALTDYLNRHPEILIYQESPEITQQGEVTLDLSTFERMLDVGPKEAEDSTSNDGDDHAEPLANKDPARLRWIGASNPDYVRHMESIAGNNPGARFIVVYCPIEEVAASWETKDSVDHLGGNDGFEQAAKTWSRSLQGTRRFIRKSLLPRVLLVNYHDLLYRSETFAPLISRFLELEVDATADRAFEALRSESGKLPKETLSREKRSLIEKHANRATEAWILDRIDEQWQKPGLYTQETSKAALATSLDEMEARTWRLQQKVKELERDRERRRRRFTQLKSSRTWKLVNQISDIRAKIAGK